MVLGSNCDESYFLEGIGLFPSLDKFLKSWQRPGAIWTGFAKNGMDRKLENAQFWEPAFKGTFRGPLEVWMQFEF